MSKHNYRIKIEERIRSRSGSPAWRVYVRRSPWLPWALAYFRDFTDYSEVWEYVRKLENQQ